MAQIGSRLIDATAAKITEDFFKAFEANLQARQAPAEAAAPVAPPARVPEPVGTWVWVLAAIVVLAAAYFILR